jgi:putative ABC transport system ATP-binding protein
MIQLRNLTKTYDTPAGPFTALQAIDLDIGRGELVALVGRSGSGKSTLLHLLGGIDAASAGSMRVAGTDLASLDEARLAAWRGRTVGFVFQFFQLMPALTAAENVMLPMDFCRCYPAAERRPRALALLDRFGVGRQAHKLPSTLSGGEQQRVAIARALANEPPLLLADEPTGNLDSATASSVIELFRELARSGTTVVLATHDRDAVRTQERVVTLADGAVAG